jgi:hypothetical protein
MKTVISELKERITQWKNYHRTAKAIGDKYDARKYWNYMKELRAAIKKLETP